MKKPPRPESSYFKKQDFVKKQKIAEHKRKILAKEEHERLKQVHWRRCGNCGLELEEISFKGESIHKCFNCGSVLLLPGTMKKLCGEEMLILDTLLNLFRF